MDKHNSDPTLLTRGLKGAALAAALATAAACSSHGAAAPKQTHKTVAATARPSATPEKTSALSATDVSTQRAALRSVGVNAAMQILNDLDKRGEGTTRDTSDGEAYIGNKAALIDSKTSTTTKGDTRPEMRAVYLQKPGLIEILGVAEDTVTSGPNKGQEIFNSVNEIFRVPAGAPISLIEGNFTTNDFRRALQDTRQIELIASDTEAQSGFNEKTKRSFGTHTSIEFFEDKVYKDPVVGTEFMAPHETPTGDVLSTDSQLSELTVRVTDVTSLAQSAINAASTVR